MSDDRPDDPAADRHRHVRSFVLRAGRLTHAQERALEVLWPLYGIELSAAPLDLDAIFQRHAPRVLEIGFGAGEALLAFASTHPEYDCIGIEVHPPGVGHLLLGVERERLANVRVIAHDAVEVLAQALAPQSIDLIHIFFPDPWPKKRHHKRRLIQPAFVRLLERVLSRHGEIRLATDWEHYALQMRDVFESDASFTNVHGANTFAPRADVRPLTRFEQRGQRLGHGVWDLHYRRRVSIG
ncbi:MAG TPA: tRNA (guanosine(46)-N7)-methyltransferase TrmB [Steroidobacteraceae bacterium]|nr:tRNA (guanosine(46)-N7)-methyltransferase TrmB [Steroidobacteraceae bacterium]